ncbi:MAG: hypothetical protein JJ975_14495 [Bacteroidia bacterium]|nr:hypothetical protein [Bacteroidia bacterium]
MVKRLTTIAFIFFGVSLLESCLLFHSAKLGEFEYEFTDVHFNQGMCQLNWNLNPPENYVDRVLVNQYGIGTDVGNELDVDSFSAFCILVHFEDSITKKLSYALPQQGIVPGAWALSESYYEYHLTNPIRDIKVVTVYDLDSNHTKGDDVSELFLAGSTDNDWYNVQPLKKEVSNQMSYCGSKQGYNLEGNLGLNLSLVLQPQTFPNTFSQFEITVRFETGEEVVHRTEPIILRNK